MCRRQGVLVVTGLAIDAVTATNTALPGPPANEPSWAWPTSKPKLSTIMPAVRGNVADVPTSCRLYNGAIAAVRLPLHKQWC